jgi:uncharacterized protein YprB with RNaseH-like and TPR domain
LRIAVLDIETTGLNATYGRLLCACFKFDDERRPRTVEVPFCKDEPKALKQIKAWYNEADVVATWNGKRFDVPFINGRLMVHKMDPLPAKMHKDLLYESQKMRFHSPSLMNLS